MARGYQRGRDRLAPRTWAKATAEWGGEEGRARGPGSRGTLRLHHSFLDERTRGSGAPQRFSRASRLPGAPASPAHPANLCPRHLLTPFASTCARAPAHLAPDQPSRIPGKRLPEPS